MRAAGELAEHGGDRKSSREGRGLILKDLIGNRAQERASAWDRLSILSEGRDRDCASTSLRCSVK
jgi:hypothetical protein